MEKMERQMTQDVARLKKRKTMREMGRTLKGRIWLMIGWLFSLYCVWRVFVVSSLFLILLRSLWPKASKHAHSPAST